jgi:drug/metabolite transporter (DMT)-like permease
MAIAACFVFRRKINRSAFWDFFDSIGQKAPFHPCIDHFRSILTNRHSVNQSAFGCVRSLASLNSRLPDRECSGNQGAMKKDSKQLAARAAPAVFVVLWSTGFIATKYVVNNAEPLSYLAIRMAIVVLLMAIIVAIARPKWPDRIGIFHSAVAGILVHGFYLGGTAVAISHSIPAGLSALIPGLQPILTSTLANRWLGERVTPLQWTGLLLGLGGVVLILHNRPISGEAGWGWLASGVSLVSITLGTLAYLLFGERLDAVAITGMAACAAAVFLVNRR